MANDPTLDHLMPVSRGGEHSYRNVGTAHRGCNSRKGARQVA
jgi:5-methylcytosine-specific restriction endonuclease McrA